FRAVSGSAVGTLGFDRPEIGPLVATAQPNREIRPGGGGRREGRGDRECADDSQGEPAPANGHYAASDTRFASTPPRYGMRTIWMRSGLISSRAPAFPAAR